MRISTEWKKISRDLLENKGRTLLVTLAIAVGVVSFGSMFISQELLLSEMTKQYLAIRPTTISISGGPFDEATIKWLKDQPEIDGAQGDTVSSAKIIKEGRTYNTQLFTNNKFEAPELNQLEYEAGNWPPGRGEIIFERTTVNTLKLNRGDQITLELIDGSHKTLTYTGKIHDLRAIPANLYPNLSGYVSEATLTDLGYQTKFNRISILTKENFKTKKQLEDYTDIIKTKIENRGMRVSSSEVSEPGIHWAEANSKAFTAILSVVGTFSLLLSGFLVINTISAILAQQKKQIGVMKAIGASKGQITKMYVLTVGAYGILALIMAVPLSMALGYVFLSAIDGFLNLNILNFHLPLKIFLMELAAALIVPIIAGIWPIISSSKMPVVKALYSFGSGQDLKHNFVYKAVTKIKGLTRPALLSLRNTFQKQGRLWLTIGTLTLAGALFMSVVNVRSSLMTELYDILKMFQYDSAFYFSKNYDTGVIRNKLLSIENVSQVEVRNGVRGQIIKGDGEKGGMVGISGLPYDSKMVDPTLLSGRWLNKTDRNAIVVSSPLAKDEPDLKTGNIITLEIDNKEYAVEVVGVASMAGDKMAFANFDYVAEVSQKPNMTNEVFIKVNKDKNKSLTVTADEIRSKLKKSGIEVAYFMNIDTIIATNESQFNFLVAFLLAMAVMVAIVGGLGQAGTMGMNVMERTREIGVLRSIGATNGSIRKLVITEGLIIGISSFILSVPLSIPGSLGFNYALGNAFFERPMTVTYAFEGYGFWLILILVIAMSASILPAYRASKMSIRETLSYE